MGLSRHFVAIVLLACCERAYATSYYMDKNSDCGRTVNVYDNGVKIYGRSLNAPSNPLLECVIYLRSSYTRDDGSNKLQIDVESLNIKDCQIVLNLYSGRKSVGEYLKSMSCGKPPSVIYSNTNEVTIRLSRPNTLYNTEYEFTLLIKPWKDRSVMTSDESNDKLSIGAIIGITFGCMVVIGVIILLCWCCCTGRISGFGDRFATSSEKPLPANHVNSGLTEEKYKPPTLVLNQQPVWNSNTAGMNHEYQPRYFQRGVPRNDMGMGTAEHNLYTNRPPPQGYAQRQGESRDKYTNGMINRRPFQEEPDDWHDLHNKFAEKKASPKREKKETLIDDVFDSDSNTGETDIDDATLQKRPISEDDDGKTSSPKSRRRNQSVPEEEEDVKKSPHLARYKSMDLQSQPDTDTITSPVHVNAAVRASVEDDLGGSPVGSLRKNKPGSKSPKSKHKTPEGGKHPDPMAMPPEAFEPIFNEPISDINYPGAGMGYHHQMQPQFPGGFMPYGLIPSGAFAPGVPGSQTYAYAYQTMPPGGVAGQPAAQGAWVVQNTPTSDGNRRTAFAVEETVSPDRSSSSPDKYRNPFGKPHHRDSGGSSKKPRGGGGRDRGGYAPDLSVVTRGAAPPEPGQGQRSVVLKSGTDPDTGIHTVQGVWTDTVPDPTDPGPGEENPQITRRTVTRVTTKSGHGELPPEHDPLIALEDGEPAFLSPSSRPAIAYKPPPARSQGNIDFYTGTVNGSTALPMTLPDPERSSTPTSTHRAPAYNSAIRDRIPLDDSTV